MAAVMVATGFCSTAVSAKTVEGTSGVNTVCTIQKTVVHTGKKTKALRAEDVLSKMKRSMKSSYTCDAKLKAEDGISYYGLDKKKVESMAYEANSNSSLNMDVAVIVKVKKGYAKTAQKKLQKGLDQTVDYNKLYDMDGFRVSQARIFVSGNYVGMFILGKRSSGNAQQQAKQAKSEAAKIDKAWKSVFGGKVKNLAKVS